MGVRFGSPAMGREKFYPKSKWKPNPSNIAEMADIYVPVLGISY
jgi:hypothetical protein